MRVFSCEAAHIIGLQPQPEQSIELQNVHDRADGMSKCGFAFSFWTDNDVCVGCVGVAELWTGCGQGWALFSKEAGPHMLAITRFWQHMLDNVIPFRRVQATAVLGFEAADRWLKILGFRVECKRMKRYDWAGRDHVQYARVRDG